jgi:hypothetical protein
MNPSTEVPTSLPPSPSDQAADNGRATLMLAPEDYPNIDHLVFEDGKPVDNFYVEKLQRLLTEPLYSCWQPAEGKPFLVASNVGLFSAVHEPPEVPDAMLSVGVRVAQDLERKENRSYLVWVLGKVPDVVIEIVSDKRGGEDTTKMRRYAYIGIPYYVIYDPQQHLKQEVLRAFTLRARTYEPIDAGWFPDAGIGVTLWEGEFEGERTRWLRWCGRDGRVIPTGKERAEQERQQNERLREKLRDAGIDPDA